MWRVLRRRWLTDDRIVAYFLLAMPIGLVAGLVSALTGWKWLLLAWAVIFALPPLAVLVGFLVAIPAIVLASDLPGEQKLLLAWGTIIFTGVVDLDAFWIVAAWIGLSWLGVGIVRFVAQRVLKVGGPPAAG